MGRIGTRIRTLTSPLADRSLRRLWYARIVSELGNWAARIALSLHVFAESGSALAATAVTAVSVLPHLGIGQLLGTLADRFPHRTVMVTADLVRGLLYLVLAGTDLPVPWVLALAFLAGMGDPPFVAAYSAALPQLAGDRYLVVQTLFTSTRQVMVLSRLRPRRPARRRLQPLDRPRAQRRLVLPGRPASSSASGRRGPVPGGSGSP